VSVLAQSGQLGPKELAPRRQHQFRIRQCESVSTRIDRINRVFVCGNPFDLTLKISDADRFEQRQQRRTHRFRPGLMEPRSQVERGLRCNQCDLDRFVRHARLIDQSSGSQRTPQTRESGSND
jgi:hypothetical protein